MSCLTVYHETSPDIPNKVLTHFEDIAATLAEHGIGFERQPVAGSVAPGSSSQIVVEACGGQLGELSRALGYPNTDIISLNRDHAQKAEQRGRFLDERRHTAAESWFLLGGRGLLNVHVGHHVFALLCEKGDIITLASGTQYWLDLGEEPHIVLVRLHSEAEGGLAEFTDKSIAGRFPRLDD